MQSKTKLTTLFLVFVVMMNSCASPTLQVQQNTDIDILSSFENTITNIVEQSKPAIVSISVTKKELKDNKPVKTSGGGSGFLIRDDGYILTNEHVVRGAEKITVSLSNGSTHDARMVGGDRNTDIAVIKINGQQEYSVLKMADSSKVRVGQFAIAIGDPIGYKYTVTAGIVGGKNRCFHEKNTLYQYHRNYIQTDAWINPGSSGGPLINIQGEVIGVTALNPGEGSTLAVNCDLAKEISEQLIAHGRIIRGHFNADMRSVAQGIRIESVKQNTSASQCGLKRNDIIVEFDGESVPSVSDFELLIMECQIGQQYPIKVLRQDQEITLDLTIDEMPLALVGRSVNTESVSWKTLGVAVRMLENNNYQRYAYLNSEDRGLMVEKVKRNSPGSKAKISRGTLIIAINGQEIKDGKNLETYLENNSDLSEFILDIKSIQGSEKVSLIK